MPFSRRRYDTERIVEIKYNFKLLQEENASVYILKYDSWIEEHLWLFLGEYVDFVILNIINAWVSNFISQKACDKLIDKVEGYFFAYQEKLIDDRNLYKKLTYEIMIDSLNQEEWEHIGIFI